MDPTIFKPIHRIIEIDASDHRVGARIADNVHQFSVEIAHRNGAVVALHADAFRVPWTTCPGALARLQDLVGAQLAVELPSTIKKDQQCTHLFDLARLAMAHAQHHGQRRYDVLVSLGRGIAVVDGVVWLDGAERLRWNVVEGRVVSPGSFYGHATTGPTEWPSGADDPGLREAALLLRRALLVFLGSGRSSHTLRADELPFMEGACYTFQPGQVDSAERPTGFRHYPAEAVEQLTSNWLECLNEPEDPASGTKRGSHHRQRK